MAVCILLTTLTEEGKKNLNDNPERIVEYNRALETLGIRVVGQYALIGQYDLLEIFEGKSKEAIYKAGRDLADQRVSQTIVLMGMSLEELIEPRKK